MYQRAHIHTGWDAAVVHLPSGCFPSLVNWWQGGRHIFGEIPTSYLSPFTAINSLVDDFSRFRVCHSHSLAGTKNTSPLFLSPFRNKSAKQLWTQCAKQQTNRGRGNTEEAAERCPGGSLHFRYLCTNRILSLPRGRAMASRRGMEVSRDPDRTSEATVDVRRDRRTPAACSLARSRLNRQPHEC